SCMPLRVGMPSEASPPETGRSTPILMMSPPVAAPPLVAVGLAAAAVVLVGAAAAAGVSVAAGAAGVAVGVSPPHALRIMLNTSSSAALRYPYLEDLIVRDRKSVV